MTARARQVPRTYFPAGIARPTAYDSRAISRISPASSTLIPTK